MGIRDKRALPFVDISSNSWCTRGNNNSVFVVICINLKRDNNALTST